MFLISVIFPFITVIYSIPNGNETKTPRVGTAARSNDEFVHTGGLHPFCAGTNARAAIIRLRYVPAFSVVGSMFIILRKNPVLSRGRLTGNGQSDIIIRL